MFKWKNFSESLLVRSVYLITIPIVLVQIIGIIIFFELHWDLVLKRSAQSISNEIKMGAIGQVLWAVDAVSPNDNANYINSGVEVTLLNNLLFFRAGANSMFLSDREKEYSFGFGLKVPGVMRNQIFLNYWIFRGFCN